MTDPPKNCPQCGKTLEAEFPEPLCPACLMAGAAKPTEAGTMVDPDLQNNTVPDLTSIQAAFPQFEIIELIGRGGMGVVYKARQTHLDRLVALKILPAGNQADTAFAERFTREAKVLARLNHPNIVTLHDFGQTDDFFYLVMEYIDGVNLRQAMRAGGFSPEQALGVVPRICEALQFAHGEGILHRDIKPDNILLNSKGRIKIADFGIAKVMDQSETPIGRNAEGSEGTAVENADPGLTGASSTLGTPQYMAPEQLTDPQRVDHRADIYSLGVVFYEMLTGELPTGRFAPPSECAESDQRLDAVVLRALEKERDQRQQSVGEIQTQVETIASTPPPLTPPKSPNSNTRPPGAGIGFALASLILALIGFPLAIGGTLLLTFVGAKFQAAASQAANQEIEALQEASEVYRRQMADLERSIQSPTERRASPTHAMLGRQIDRATRRISELEAQLKLPKPSSRLNLLILGALLLLFVLGTACLMGWLHLVRLRRRGSVAWFAPAAFSALLFPLAGLPLVVMLGMNLIGGFSIGNLLATVLSVVPGLLLLPFLWKKLRHWVESPPSPSRGRLSSPALTGLAVTALLLLTLGFALFRLFPSGRSHQREQAGPIPKTEVALGEDHSTFCAHTNGTLQFLLYHPGRASTRIESFPGPGHSLDPIEGSIFLENGQSVRFRQNIYNRQALQLGPKIRDLNKGRFFVLSATGSIEQLDLDWQTASWAHINQQSLAEAIQSYQSETLADSARQDTPAPDDTSDMPVAVPRPAIETRP